MAHQVCAALVDAELAANESENVENVLLAELA
jgi:hypothetical protein